MNNQNYPTLVPNGQPNIFTPQNVVQIPHGEGPLGYNLQAPTLMTTGHGVATGQIGYTYNPVGTPFTQPTIVGNGPILLGKYNWNNPYGRNIPVIPFDASCQKCHGGGVVKTKFSGTPLPCSRCYTRLGFCKKCYGTGLQYRKDAVCKCEKGKRSNHHNRRSSSSSEKHA